jgi:predicted nucleic acid-binding protein
VLDAALATTSTSSPARPCSKNCAAYTYLKLQAVIGDADEIVQLVALTPIVVTPTETVAISRDPDDDRLIETALAGRAPTGRQPPG